MRHVGRATPEISHQTGADGLRAAAAHLAIGNALMAVNTLGIPKGVYRFKTHEEADAQMQEGIVRAIILNVQARENPGPASTA